MLQVRKALPEDASLIATLTRETFYDSFAADNTAEDMELYLAEHLQPEALEKEIFLPGNHFFIAWDGQRPVGYLRLRERPEGHPDCIPAGNSIELARFYATADSIGKGVGKAMMAHLLEYASGLGFERIWLGVWEHNHRAIGFYQKWGFEKVGSHPFMLGRDLQTDWLMTRELP